jgi:hypothetical protein
MVLVTAKSMNGGSANTSTEFEQDLRSLMASADDFVRTKTATVCVFSPKGAVFKPLLYYTGGFP